MLNYLRITRPINLIIIGLTVFILQCLVKTPDNWISLETFLMVLKALVLVLIAAGGYAINDYFDQRADAVNKPKEQIVGIHLTGKRAILMHIVLSSLALVSSFFLSHVYHNHFYWSMSLILIFALLVYTPFFKRTMIFGNVLVAAIVACLPWWALMDIVPASLYSMVWAMVFFSFVSNWIREVVKDIQDVEGDAVGQYRSIALVKGIASAAQLVKWAWLGLLFSVIVFQFFFVEPHKNLSLNLMVVPGLLGWFPTWIAKEPADFKRIARLMKLWMVLATAGFILLFV